VFEVLFYKILLLWPVELVEFAVVVVVAVEVKAEEADYELEEPPN